MGVFTYLIFQVWCTFATGLLRIRAKGNFLVDQYERVRLFRGFSDIQQSKGRGYRPGGPDYLPQAFLPGVRKSSDILHEFEANGFNVVRLPMMWAAAAPFQNYTDKQYLHNIQEIVDALEANNIYSLLDMHQDGFAPGYAGGYDGIPRWLINRTKPRHNYPWPFAHSPSMWEMNYLTEAAGQCFGELYADTHGGLRDWAAFWHTVAGQFVNRTGVLGYELINEPWVGDHLQNPELFLPGVAGHKNLMPSYRVLAKAIREVDNATAIFFEPVTWGMIFGARVVGSGFDSPPVPNSVFTFHYYCWMAAQQNNSAPPSKWVRESCDDVLGPKVFAAVHEDSIRLSVPSFMSEWGGKTPSARHPHSLATAEITAVQDLADSNLCSWTMYDLVSVLGKNYSLPWGDRVRDAVVPFARPYAQATAGIPTKMRNTWKVVNGSMQGDVFTLEFDIATAMRPALRSVPTEIAVPALWFPVGYSVRVSPGFRWEMAANRSSVIAVWIVDGAEPTNGSVIITGN